MAVNGHQNNDLNPSESGQSVLEFLLALPLLIVIALLMIKSNTAIQVSIVDQKYARAQMFFVAGNGAWFPRRDSIVDHHAAKGVNQLILGVSDNQPDKEGESNDNKTLASTVYIGRKKGMGDETQQEPTSRANIRIRNTVHMCLPLVSLKGGRIYAPSSPGMAYRLSENPQDYEFCNTKQDLIL